MDTSTFDRGIKVTQSRGRLTLEPKIVVSTGKPVSETCFEGSKMVSSRAMTGVVIFDRSNVSFNSIESSSGASEACDGVAVCSDSDEGVSLSRGRTMSSQSAASTMSSQSSGANSPTWSGGADSIGNEIDMSVMGASDGARTTTRAAANGSPKYSSSVSFPKTGKRGCPQQFPRKLFDMLEEQTFLRECAGPVPSPSLEASVLNAAASLSATATLPACIQWVASGKAFVITDMSSFTSHVLPHYFKTTKFSSFQRNLNLYGFSKVIRGPDRGSYFNHYFARGDEANLLAVKRVKRPRKKAQFEIGGGGWERNDSSNAATKGRAEEKELVVDALALLAKACAAGE